MHSLLRRQLKREGLDLESPPQNLAAVIRAVDEAYTSFDGDRLMLERSLDLSSQELLAANSGLRATDELLRATLESTADGILAVDEGGAVTYFNPRFAELWRIPEQLLASKDDGRLLDFVLEQLAEPEAFLAKVRELYASSDESFDTLPFRDGRVFERYSRPLVRGDTIAGRVWSFRDVTQRKHHEQRMQASEERYRVLFDTSTDAVLIIDADAQILFANPATREVLGYEPAELIGRNLSLLQPERLREAHLAGMRRYLASGEKSLDWRAVEIAGLHKDGREMPLEISFSDMQIDGATLFAGFMRDISARKQADAALQRGEELLRSTLESTTDGILVVDGGGKISYLNTQFGELWRIPEELRTGGNGERLLEQVMAQLEDPQAVFARARELFNSSDESYDTLRLGDGRTFEQYTRPLLERGATAGRVWSFRDVTAQKRSEHELQSTAAELKRSNADLTYTLVTLAETNEKLEENSALLERTLEAERERSRRDSLTGTLNHAAITEALRAAIASGGGGEISVAMIDVDGLKAANDTYGHRVGDAVLSAIARALSTDGAVVGRYGGDEFVAILSGSGRAAAERYRETTLAAMARAGVTDPLTGASVPVVASVGLAVYPAEASSIEELILLADSAMYAAKRERPGGATTASRALGGAEAAQMVGEIVPYLTSSENLNEKLRLVSQRLSVGAGYDAVHFEVYENDLKPPTATNTFAQVPKELIRAWNEVQRQTMENPVVELARRTRQPIILDDLEHEELVLEGQRKILVAAGIKSGIFVPMFWGDQMIGNLQAGSKHLAAFTPRDAHFLNAVANQVTAIVRMAELVEDLQAASTRLSDSQAETVMLLAAAAEAHDQTTGRHLQRVRTISEALALELGHEAEDARALGLAATLHDIGKIRVPDGLLSSPAKLSDAEWVIMRQHTIWGAEFLGEREGFELAATVARCHHERWDGEGYPFGLAGEDIPEPAAIVSVADAFDAMTSDRPYRPRRTPAWAVREVQEGAGRQFSPRVVEALVRLHERGELAAGGEGEEQAAA